MTNTPETEILNEIETPVELTPEEMTDARYSYDLPRNDDAKAGVSEQDAVDANVGPAASDASEEDSQSEIPGDPRQPHEMQPPTKDEY